VTDEKPKTHIVYRYDSEEYQRDQIIRSQRDHFRRLSDDEKTVENCVRKTMPDGERIPRLRIQPSPSRARSRTHSPVSHRPARPRLFLRNSPACSRPYFWRDGCGANESSASVGTY
jgi:hypothetical protein